MTYENTVEPALTFLDSLGPWGILVGVVLTYVGPRLTPLVAKLGPAAVAAYTAVLALFAKRKPADPVPPTPAEPSPTRPAHPLLHQALSILKMAALARFPWLGVEEALLEYAKEHVQARSPQALEDVAHQTEPPFCTRAFVTPAPAAIRDYPPSAGD